MSDWQAFCEELDFSSLVPDTFARYRPAILAGLAYFLEHLPPERTFAILAGQAELPEDAEVGARLVEIAHHCPALHKLGQVMARDRRLPAGFRHLLQRLETLPPKTAVESLRRDIEAEIGPLGAIGVTLGGEALAEASVAVVVPYVWRDAGEARRGVFKVLKPGIEERLNQELALLQAVGALLDEQCHAYGLPEIDYEETFIQVRELLRREVHLDEEQRNLGAAATAYAGMPRVRVPAVHPFSTPRLTAMTRIDGRKVTEVGELDAAQRRDLAALILEALLARPIWSSGPATLFHADPHAGNLLLTPDRGLGLLDWSLIGRLTKDDQVYLSQILIGALTLNAGQIVGAITALAEGGIDGDAIEAVVEDNLRRIAGGALPGFDWLTRLMDDAVIKARARFAGNLIVFRKVLQTLQGVVADVCEECRADEVLAACFVRRFGADLAGRAVAPPFSRDFATHLSNADLVQVLSVAPLAASRYWLAWQQRLWSAAGDT